MINKDLLSAHNNNYIKNKQIRALKPLVSIILPCFNVASSLPFVIDALNNQTHDKIEIIVVDDCSVEDLKISLKNSIHQLKYIRHLKRQDRSAARNTGLRNAEGEFVLILDPDIVLNPQAIEKLIRAYDLYGDNLYIGFREDIELDALKIKLIENINADYKKDMRWMYNYTAKVPQLNIFGKESCSRIIRILEETNLLKDFSSSRVIGAWDLASVVHGHNLFMKTKTALQVGGFDESFTGWGFDDIAFGAKMIIEGFFIIPVLESVGFHIMHSPHSGSEDDKWKEFSQNKEKYFKWLEREYEASNFNFYKSKELAENVIFKSTTQIFNK